MTTVLWFHRQDFLTILMQIKSVTEMTLMYLRSEQLTLLKYYNQVEVQLETVLLMTTHQQQHKLEQAIILLFGKMVMIIPTPPSKMVQQTILMQISMDLVVPVSQNKMVHQTILMYFRVTMEPMASTIAMLRKLGIQTFLVYINLVEMVMNLTLSNLVIQTIQMLTKKVMAMTLM